MLVQCTCRQCGDQFEAKPSTVARGGGQFCSKACYGRYKTIPLATRFAALRGPVNENGCQLWLGYIGKKGYGQLTICRRSQSAHCIAWELFRGPIPEGLEVCHTCDIRHCVNPAHLFLGTSADNSADMVRKGRSCRGARNGQAKLTDVQVVRDQYAAGIPVVALAEERGVTPSAIYYAIRGDTWT